MLTRKIWFAVGLIMTLGGQAGVALAQAPEPAVESLRSCRPEVTWSADAPETIGLLAAVCPRDERLSGAWQVTLAPGPGDAAPSARALTTFTSDGTVLVANPGFTQVPCLGGGRGGCSVPGAASAGMGAWIRTGDAEYSMTYVHLLYDAIGNYSGRAKVRAVAVVSQPEGDLSGHFITEVFDQNDDQVNSAGGRIEARRIVAEETPRGLPVRAVYLRRR